MDEGSGASDDASSGSLQFSCKANSAEILISMLQSILLDKDQVIHAHTTYCRYFVSQSFCEQVALCSITEAGMKFTVEKSHVLQVKAYLKRLPFQEFALAQGVESIEFSLNLSVFLQCLQVFGQSSHLELSYAGQGHPLSILYVSMRVLSIPDTLDCFVFLFRFGAFAYLSMSCTNAACNLERIRLQLFHTSDWKSSRLSLNVACEHWTPVGRWISISANYE